MASAKNGDSLIIELSGVRRRVSQMGVKCNRTGRGFDNRAGPVNDKSRDKTKCASICRRECSLINERAVRVISAGLAMIVENLNLAPSGIRRDRSQIREHPAGTPISNHAIFAVNDHTLTDCERPITPMKNIAVGVTEYEFRVTCKATGSSAVRVVVELNKAII